MNEQTNSPPLAPPPLPRQKKSSTGCMVTLAFGITVPTILLLVVVALEEGWLVKFLANPSHTKRHIKDLELAIRAYQTEYNRFPSFQTDEQKTLEAQGEMLDVIMAKHPDKNPRGIQFYDPPRPSPRGKGGLIINAAGQPELHDIFGNVYRMRFDWNRDGIIPDPEHPGTSIAAPVIIYSAGPDGDYNTWKDNVKSWVP